MEHETDREETNGAAAFDWEQRYAEDDAVWSGHVNGSLVAEVGDVRPGTVLDIGCGEGADAVWLAEHGWQVTAVDVSQTAVDRGREAADQRGLRIDWRATDILAAAPEHSFDLVSLHYPAFPIERCNDVVAMLTNAVTAGGTLLVVGHAPPVDPATAPFDPADWTLIPDIAEALDSSWIVDVHETRPRVGDHHHGSPHTHDVVFRVRKPQ